MCRICKIDYISMFEMYTYKLIQYKYWSWISDITFSSPLTLLISQISVIWRLEAGQDPQGLLHLSCSLWLPAISYMCLKTGDTSDVRPKFSLQNNSAMHYMHILYESESVSPKWARISLPYNVRRSMNFLPTIPLPAHSCRGMLNWEFWHNWLIKSVWI